MLTDKDIENIKSGDCVLLLGAGATMGSTRFKNDRRPILGAKDLAKKIAQELGLKYSDEHLREVYDAAIDTKKDKNWIYRLLKTEYTSIKPSQEVSRIFNYPWYRVYTLNIDDSLRNIPRPNRVQDVQFVNGVNTDRTEWAGRMSCQVVHLHGMAWEIGNGVVFSDEEYGAVYERRLGWYQQLREDFRTRSVYIIGSELDEPFILSLIKREAAALKDANSALLIVPNTLSDIRQKSLGRANIMHSKGTLAEFISEIGQRLGANYSPINIVAKETNIADLLTDRFSKEDVPALQSLFLVDEGYFDGILRRLPSDIRRDRARFFEGYGPNWGIVADPAFAELRQYKSLDESIDPVIEAHRLIVLRGEAGSGKSTYLYRHATQLARRGKLSVFQYRETSASFYQAMNALKRFMGDGHAVVLIDDFRVYAEDVSNYLCEHSANWLTFIADARSSEWSGLLRRLFPSNVLLLDLDRFHEDDVDEIVEVIEKKHVAPIFNALPIEDRKDALARSRKQLLFAIREASQSKEFDQLIADEVGSVNNSVARAILLLVAFSTLARTGLKRDVAASITDDLISRLHQDEEQLPFGEGLQLLPGMVDQSSSGMLRVRHDDYASVVLGRLATVKEIRAVIESILHYFSQFETPIIGHISKMEGQLFKYSLNNRNIYRLFDGRQTEDDTISIYAGMEQRLQLDGHFWLQYGLLLRRFGRHEEALTKFERSIEAYDNDFARHAQAQQQLIIAATMPAHRFNEASLLVGRAESYLVERHHNPTTTRRRLEDSDYPISVLGHYHIDALVHIDRNEEAQRRARTYYNWISEMEKRIGYVSLSKLKERLMKMGVSGIWERNRYRVGETDYHD